MYLLNENILDKQEASTEEIPSETAASLTLLETGTPALISEPPSEPPVSSYKPPTGTQAFVGKLSSDSHSRPGRSFKTSGRVHDRRNICYCN
jgi:hypothetical protein